MRRDADARVVAALVAAVVAAVAAVVRMGTRLRNRRKCRHTEIIVTYEHAKQDEESDLGTQDKDTEFGALPARHVDDPIIGLIRR